MSWQRGIMVGVGLLVASAAQAQQSSHLRAGVWRNLPVPPTGEASPETVPELRVAPGSATLLHLPSPILPGGFTVSGGQARVDVQQVTPTTLVIVPTTEVGPERIPLAVSTTDQRRYPFLMATRPEVVDLEVRVVFSEPSRADEPSRSNDDLLEALLDRQEVYSRRYETTSSLDPTFVKKGKEGPVVEAAVRMGGRYFIQLVDSGAIPWKIQQAKLQGTNGLLAVESIRWGGGRVGENVNVIVTKVPAGVDDDYVLTGIELVAEDARVARRTKAISLP